MAVTSCTQRGAGVVGGEGGGENDTSGQTYTYTGGLGMDGLFFSEAAKWSPST